MSAIIDFVTPPDTKRAWHMFWSVICWDEASGIETALEERRELLANCLAGDTVYWRCASPARPEPGHADAANDYANAARNVDWSAYQQSPFPPKGLGSMATALDQQLRNDFGRAFGVYLPS